MQFEKVRARKQAKEMGDRHHTAPMDAIRVFLAVSVLFQLVTGESPHDRKEQQCYNYAGGHVYPGEAFRVPGSDHSLHLSKAKISKPAPFWEGTAVINGEFKDLRLSDYRGKYLVFFFYPLDFTFVCPTEIIAFSDRVQEFRAINAEVVACSVDSQFTHLAWINTPRKQGGLGPLKIPLLSDLTHQIAKDYGVYLEDQGHTLRGLFIVDDKGVLRQITMNDLPVGRSVDETLRLVQAFQYTDKHGEVCPAGWKPGSDTINPEEAMKAWWPREEL
ncbi:peroxiredoxin-4-like isoform X2 [Megalops cyprinoides]|uniref:peroxiredoxin-4-like isoform X2 n=1 Tax=Megalops cyprinoides TaxID=118141 RepID=UPI001865659B|nr:peroxiredoxin-4-like isoform X2 [Megalops cyprinoides]